MYCQKCGTKIGKETTCKKCGSKLEFNRWRKYVSISLIILSIINLILAPIIGIGLLFIALLFFGTKSLSVLYFFAVILLLIAFMELLIGLYYKEWYMLLYTLINGGFGIYIFYKINDFKKEI